MEQWEEKLGAILNDPQTMGRILSIAQSLEGGADQAAPAAEVPAGPAPAMPELDPRLMEAGMRALSAWQDPNDPRAALLTALRPFVSQRRQAKVDKAIRVARLSKAVRAALDGLGGGGADV